MRSIIHSASSLSISVLLLMLAACSQSHSDAQVPPQVSTILWSGQEFQTVGPLTKSEDQILQGSGSLQALDLLNPSRETFRLQFDLNDAESSLALHLYTKAGLADGLNLEFYPKQDQLFVLANTSDTDGVITSLNEPLGKYSPTDRIELSIQVTLDALGAPQLLIQRSLSDTIVHESSLRFPESTKPLAIKERNWSLYLSKASVTTLFHEALQ